MVFYYTIYVEPNLIYYDLILYDEKTKTQLKITDFYTL